MRRSRGFWSKDLNLLDNLQVIGDTPNSAFLYYVVSELYSMSCNVLCSLSSLFGFYVFFCCSNITSLRLPDLVDGGVFDVEEHWFQSKSIGNLST